MNTVTSRDCQKLAELDLYAISNSITDLIRKRVVKSLGKEELRRQGRYARGAGPDVAGVERSPRRD